MKIVGVVMLLAAAYFVPRSDSDREDEKKGVNAPSPSGLLQADSTIGTDAGATVGGQEEMSGYHAEDPALAAALDSVAYDADDVECARYLASAGWGAAPRYLKTSCGQVRTYKDLRNVWTDLLDKYGDPLKDSCVRKDTVAFCISINAVFIKDSKATHAALKVVAEEYPGNIDCAEYLAATAEGYACKILETECGILETDHGDNEQDYNEYVHEIYSRWNYPFRYSACTEKDISLYCDTFYNER